MIDLYAYVALGLSLGYFAGLGLSVGFIGGFVGIGGGPFLVSCMVLYFGMTQLEAQGHVLTMMLGPMSLLGVLSLYNEVKNMWVNIIIGVIGYCIMSYFGALMAFTVGEQNIKIYFGILLFLIAGIQVATLTPYLQTSEDKNKTPKDNLSVYWAGLLGGFTGFFGGLLGIGAGVLMVPILLYIFNVRKDYARALSLAILVPPVSYGAYVKYNHEVNIDWGIVFTLFFTYFIANYFGAKMGTKASPKVFKVVYSVILILLGLVYLY